MSHYSSMEEDHQEMQLFSFTPPPQFPSSSHPPPWPPNSSSARFGPSIDHFDVGPSLDLQLSISVTPLGDHYNVDALKWETAEQIRLAAMEKAYAERVMEMTRKEMELAQSEFVRAHALWERAREEVERAEKMKERATRISRNSMCMEITCLSCMQKFRP